MLFELKTVKIDEILLSVLSGVLTFLRVCLPTDVYLKGKIDKSEAEGIFSLFHCLYKR